MPSRSAKAPLQDILRHIDLAQTFAGDLPYREFCDDLRTVYAIVRCLKIISEASRRLPESLKARHTRIPWKNVAGAGNVYRHDYEDVAAALVWETLRRELPPLRSVVVAELRDAG